MRDALAFLTVLPVRASGRAPGRSALLAFPLVGAAIGALWALLAWAGWHLWGPFPAAAAVTLADLGVTGALHLDAVADVADGWASRKPPREAVTVMRDPRVGAVGAAVLASVLLARWSLIATIAARGEWWLLVVPPVAGRAAMVWTLHRSVGRDGTGPSLADPFLAAGITAAVAVLGLSLLIAGAAGGPRGLAAIVVAVLAAELATQGARRRFGGVTGDVIGAAGIGAEVLALALLAAHLTG